jgi:hypothetical protein
MVPVYFIRLMADAKKLRIRARQSPIQFNEDVQESEVPLIKLDCAMWTAPPFCRPETLGDGYNVRFYSSDSDLHGDDERPIDHPEAPQ